MRQQKHQPVILRILLLCLSVIFLLGGCGVPDSARTSGSVSGAVTTKLTQPPNRSLNPVVSGETSASGLVNFKTEFLGVFDTITTVRAFSPDEATFLAQVERIETELTRYHQLFDTYHNYPGLNNLKTINDQAGQSPVVVDPVIIQLLKQCLAANELTRGHVNVAFGSVLKIWHDYREAGIRDPGQAKLPPLADLRAANQHTDIRDLIIDEAASTVQLRDPKMRLDVGSGAKGLACELVAKTMAEAGMSYALLSLGGNIRAIGGRGDETTPWRVGIANPDKTSAEPFIRIAAINNVSVVTSGVYERFYTVDGKAYHHIIHPDTLFPPDTFDSVTIITADSGFADSLTTALFNMPYQEGLAMIESLPDVEAMWVKDGEVRLSSGCGRYIQ